MMASEIELFLSERVPRTWFDGEPTIHVDDEEVLYVGVLPAAASVEGFRDETRSERMAIAAEVEARFARKMSWGVLRAGVTTFFTTQSTPVMTRLHIQERAVLDTLVDAGVARTRSDALSWCVKLVGLHRSEWVAELREALNAGEPVRAEEPSLI